VDDAIYTDVAQQFPDAARERVALKGFSAPVGIALIEGSMVADDTPAVPRVEQTARLTTTLAALLSTPCVGYFALNSLAVWLGFGTLAAGALGTFLDQAIIRFPLLGVATLGGLTLLAVLFRHGLAAAKQDGIAAKPTPLERRRNLTGLVLALGALGLVVGELLLHGSVH
jgi:hypothetical protein